MTTVATELTDLLALLKTIFTWLLSLVIDIAKTVTTTPILLIPVAMFILTAVIYTFLHLRRA